MQRLLGRTDEGVVATEEALRIAQAAGVADVEAFSLLQRANDELRLGRSAEGLAAKALARSRMGGDRLIEVVALRLLGSQRNDVELVAQSIDLARESGALRLELIGKQVWVSMLWRSGERARARREATALVVEAARRSLRQTVSLLQIQQAQWAAEEGDWHAARQHRDAALAAGAEGGAIIERCMLVALDLGLAFVEGDVAAAERKVVALEHLAAGFAEPDFVRIVELISSMAPPALADRMRVFFSAASTGDNV